MDELLSKIVSLNVELIKLNKCIMKQYDNKNIKNYFNVPYKNQETDLDIYQYKQRDDNISYIENPLIKKI